MTVNRKMQIIRSDTSKQDLWKHYLAFVLLVCATSCFTLHSASADAPWIADAYKEIALTAIPGETELF